MGGICPTFFIGTIQIYTFPVVIMCAVFIPYLWCSFSPIYDKRCLYECTRKALPVLLFAGIGARLTSAITLFSVGDFRFIYNLIYGGSVFYGGLIGGILGLLLVCKKYHQSFLMFADVAASLLPLGHTIGRLGCYLNGCCYGCEYDGLFAVNFIVDGVATKVFPTWFFEAGFCFILFVIMQTFKKAYFIGFRTGFYLVSYSIFRFLIEYMRGDKIRGTIGTVSSSQAISIIVLIAGFSILVYSMKARKINELFLSKECITDESL